MDRIAFISGASGGIGMATVEAFASRGYSVIAHARKDKDGFSEALQALSSQYDVEIEPVYFDMLDEEAMKTAVKELFSGKLYPEVLVNNAGIAHGGLFQMTSVSTIEEVFAINLFAHMRLTQLLLRGMKRLKRGSVINVASISGIDLAPGNSAYGVSKAALIAWTKTLSKELGAEGIRVNAVAPGLTDTAMSYLMEDKAGKEMVARSVMNRKAEPAEIADVIAFLASSEARFVNGQVLCVDGGSSR